MKVLNVIGIALAIVMMVMIVRTPGANLALYTALNTKPTAGFPMGLFHGFISPVSFIISFFNENVNIYEINNNGKWYNFGFIVGIYIGAQGGIRLRAGLDVRRTTERVTHPTT